MLITNPQPRGMVSPVFPFMSPCNLYKPSTYHLITLSLSPLNIIGMYIVPCMYCSTCCILRQSSSSGSHILIFRKETDVWLSFMALSVANRSCATLWWEVVACSSSKIFLSLLGNTSNRWSPSGVGGVFIVSSGKSAINL